MQVVICEGCKKQTLYDDIAPIVICDSCKLEAPLKERGHCMTCSEVDGWDDSKEYHKSCLTKIGTDAYCVVHAKQAQSLLEAARIVDKYAKGFWRELGFKLYKLAGENENRKFGASMPGLTLDIELKPVNKNGGYDNNSGEEIIALEYWVQGIKRVGVSKFRTSIHDHFVALDKVLAAILRSLRSKKAVLSAERNAWYEDWSKSDKTNNTKSINNLNDTMALVRQKLFETRKKRSHNGRHSRNKSV